MGKLIPLRALHRYGTHTHVLSFARPLMRQDGSGMADQVAVVACNFNHAPSTFHVRCSAIAGMIGAVEHGSF